MTSRGGEPGRSRANSIDGTGSINTAGDFTYVRKKRGRLHFDDEHIDGEINIVPYLDIMVNLIMFLLMVQATSIALGMINVNAPSYAPPGPTANKPSDPKKALRLTIGIAAEGFFIAAKGGVLPGEQPDSATTEGQEPATRQPTIPRKPDGKYNFAALTAKLRGIKNAFPDVDSVYVAADDKTAYQDIVKTLDASRSDSAGPLFPNVAFTQIN